MRVSWPPGGALWLSALVLSATGCTSEPLSTSAQAALVEKGDVLSDACLSLETPDACCTASQPIETGTAGPDAFIHDPTDSTARCTFGYPSRDMVRAGSGADHILLGPDADHAEGRGGNDRIAGGDGNDWIYGDGGDDWLHGGAGDDTMDGGRGRDVLLGGPGSDRMNGAAEDDRIEGGAGDDVIDGAEGDDWIHPGEGRDEVNGGAGDDAIVAYHACELARGELIVGGPGVDRFYSPLTRRQLASLGVIVDVESIVVIPSSCQSSCAVRCGQPTAADFELGCRAACETVVACGQIDGLDDPTVAECVTSCVADLPPVGCDARAVLDAQIACLAGSCGDFFQCEVPSCE